MEVISRVEPERRGDNETVPDLSIGVLNLNNCTKTILGTHVDCHGNVTVNQYLKCDGKDEPTKLKTLKKLLVKDSTKKYSWRNVLRLKALLLAIILATFIAGTIVGTSLLFKSYNSTDEQDDDTPLPMNYTTRLKNRAQWFANERSVKPAKELKFRPARFVVVAHTAGEFCTKQINCEIIVKAIQNYDIKTYGDIRFNFLIGGDGYIYEGLGWGKDGPHTYGVGCASIGVAFMGDFNVFKPSTKQIDAFNLLIDEGVNIGEIISNYKLFSRSDIVGLDNPGLNIQKIIKDWKNFDIPEKNDFMC